MSTFYDKHLAMDFETSGKLPEFALQPWRVAQGLAWPTSLVWVAYDTQNKRPAVHGGLWPDREAMRAMLEHAITNKLRVVGWNVVFDISWLLAHGLEDLVFKVKWLDGMLLWKHATVEPNYDERQRPKSYSLKAAVPEVFPDHAGYQADVDYHGTDPAKLRELHDYNIKDVIFTLRIAKLWWDKLSSEQKRCALVEAECLPMIAKANLEGLIVDTLVTRELQAYLVKEAADALRLLAPLGMTEAIVRSPAKLRDLMFKRWKMTPHHMTPGGDPSTDKETLHELAAAGDNRAKVLRKYRDALLNKKKFADNALEASIYNGDGRAHPTGFVFSTYTGRMTYASTQGKNKDKRQIGFALHQEKGKKEGKIYRAKITPPPDYVLVEQDAAGQEFRWMAECSGDDVMKSLCLPGGDPHSYMGSKIDPTWDYLRLIQEVKMGNNPVADNLRKSGKVANLSLQYRTSYRKLLSTARVDYGMDMTIQEAELIHKVYPRTYKGVPLYWNRQISLTKQRGYVETLAGRRVKVVGNWSGTYGWAMGSTAINHRIQGTGADQKYLAMACLKDFMRNNGAYFAFDLHDGLYWFVPKDKMNYVAAGAQKILNALPYKRAWGYSPSIPLPWDTKVGPSWGDLKEWHP